MRSTQRELACLHGFEELVEHRREHLVRYALIGPCHQSAHQTLALQLLRCFTSRFESFARRDEEARHRVDR